AHPRVPAVPPRLGRHDGGGRARLGGRLCRAGPLRELRAERDRAELRSHLPRESDVIVAATLGHSLARVGLLLDALAAAGALVLTGRARRAAVVAALVLTPLLLGATLWKSSQILRLRHHHALAVAGIVAAVVLLVALAFVFPSRPRWLAFSAVLALPFRFSLLSGGTGGILLVLYAVIGGGAIALV